VSILILFFLASFFAAKNVNAQANVTATGISIQGIARDENNSAISNIDQLSLNFRIYYLDGSNAEVLILNETNNVRTDNFGVFSYVMNIPSTVFTQICNTSAYLKVTQGSVVFSNEKLQAVPYAIHAQNGVPTGTIMAYIGATAPTGWLLCDGSAIADNAATARLRELLGATTTPNLNARYLRGAGTSTRGSIALKAFQEASNYAVNYEFFSHATYGNAIAIARTPQVDAYMNYAIATGVSQSWTFKSFGEHASFTLTLGVPFPNVENVAPNKEIWNLAYDSTAYGAIASGLTNGNEYGLFLTKTGALSY
jgi:hypothetical protein